jgi:UDP-glucose 4-epimerase
VSAKTKILITGCGGYIGSVATYLFLQKGYKVVGLDNFSTGHKGPVDFFSKNFKNSFKFYQADTHDDLSGVFEKEKDISALVHYAASCLVTESMENPHKYFYNNVSGSDSVISQAVSFGIKNLVFSSTCAVYGETKYVPVDEKHPVNPVNPYGESKLMVEKIIDWYGKLKGLNYVILRYFNVCGASDDGVIGDSKKPSVLLVQNAVRGALGIAEFKLTCPEVATADKTPIRDYINVVDLNLAHLAALKYLWDGGKSEIINLGTGAGNSVLEIVKTVQKVTGKKFAVGKSEPRKGEYAKIYADNSKAKEVLGWQPERSIEKSIESLVKWYTAHPKGWAK